MASELDERVDIDLSTLDEAETGREFNTWDFVCLGLLGVVVPVVLLTLGLL